MARRFGDSESAGWRRACEHGPVMINDLLNFFASDPGLLTVGLVAGLTILVWDWRASIVGALVVQVGLAAIAVVHHGVALEWFYVQSGVLALACMILALSARQARLTGSMYHAGAWPLRLAAVILAFFCWQLLAAGTTLPVLREEETRLIVWLALMGLLMMGLGDSPYFTGIGMLFWLMLVQFGAGILFSIPALIAMIGMLELLLALACSYLILVELVPEVAAAPVITDITFPGESPLVIPPRGEQEAERDATGEWGAREVLPTFSARPAALSRSRTQAKLSRVAPGGTGSRGAMLRARLFGRMLPARRRP